MQSRGGYAAWSVSPTRKRGTQEITNAQRPSLARRANLAIAVRISYHSPPLLAARSLARRQSMREMRFPLACILRCGQVGTAIWLTLALCAGCTLPGGANSGVVEIESPKGADHKVKNGAPSSDGLTSAAPPAATEVAPPGSGFPPLTANDGYSNQSASIDRGGDDFNALSKQLQGIAGLDPAERQALLDDLKQSDPALWPQLIRQFRTALAYRNRTALAGGDLAPPSRAGETLDDEGAAAPQTIIHLEPPPPAAKSAKRDALAANDGSDAAEPAKLASKKAASPRNTTAADQPGDVQLATATAPIGKTVAPNKSSTGAASDPALGSDQWQLQLTKTILALETNSSARLRRRRGNRAAGSTPAALPHRWPPRRCAQANRRPVRRPARILDERAVRLGDLSRRRSCRRSGTPRD